MMPSDVWLRWSVTSGGTGPADGRSFRGANRTVGSIGFARLLRLVIGAGVLWGGTFVGAGGRCWGDEPDTPVTEEPSTPVTEEPDTPATDVSEVPRGLPESFDLLRPIRFFRGQASGIVPSDFRPVSIEQLDRRLTPLADSIIAEADRPQLARAVYVARLSDTALISDQTTWEITHAGRSPGRLSLGTIGMAIRSTGFATGGGGGLRTDSPPLDTDSDGNVSVTVLGDTRLSVSWTAAGEDSDREIAFDLAIPPAAQARWLIAVPMDMRLEAADGVIRPLPSPPPEATVRDSGRDLAWYGIEVGGLSRLRLRVIKSAAVQSNAPLIVRQASLSYELLPSAVRFSSRLIIDPPADGVLPSLRVKGGRMVAASVGGVSAVWSESIREDDRWVQLRSDRKEAALRSPLTITIDGEMAWDSVLGYTELPWIEFRDVVPELIGQPLQARVLVDSRLDLMRLGLPPGWEYLAPVEADERQTSYRLGGPWGSEPPTVRVAKASRQLFAHSVIRLTATETRYVATLESSISLAGSGPRPIQVRIEPGWTVENVLLPQSGRVVELPPEFANDRMVPIWPTADELDNGTLTLRAVGYQPLRLDGDTASFPASSFAGFVNCRHRVAAVVSPPPGFRWAAEASLLANRITETGLSQPQRELLGELPSEALLLEISRERMRALTSRRPVAAFAAASLVRLSTENQRVQETHFIRCDSEAGQLDQVRVEFGAGAGPEMAWSVDPSASPARRLLRARRLAPPVPESVDPREMWELTLERAGSRGVVLVGRREHVELPWAAGQPIGSRPLRVELPSVADANSRTAHVIVPESLRVVGVSEGVLKVPFADASGLGRLGETVANPGDTMLRYDSSGASWIDVLPSEGMGAPTVSWREAVEVVISGRGGDWVSASYDTQPGATLVIDCDADLQLADVTDEMGRKLEHEWSRGRLVVRGPREVSELGPSSDLAPLGGTARIHIRWSRRASGQAWWRNWEPPRINASGPILRRDWRLLAAADTVIPETLLGRLTRSVASFLVAPQDAFPAATGQRDSLAPSRLPDLRIDPERRATVWVLDRSAGMSLGVVLGILIFAGSWALCGRHPLWMGIGLLSALALLPTFSLGWGYWVAVTCLPIAAGSLLGTTLGRSRLPAGDDDALSITETARITLWLGVVIGAGWALAAPAAQAQSVERREGGSVASEPQASASRRPIVLIPTDTDGQLAGDKVYIPNGTYAELFRDKPAAVTVPLITSAVYRLRLDGMTESGMPAAEWEVRYSLANLSERSEIQLPIRPGDVRSVQWLPGGESKPLRWSADGEDRIRVVLPPTSSAALLLRFTSEVESPERRLRRVRLAVPAVASASLAVDTSVPIHRFDLSGAVGQIEAQADFGRLSADLGAIREIRLDILLRQGTRSIPAIAARRYWVHGAPGRGQIECEIEPAEEQIQIGTDVPIVVLGGVAPLLTTADWSLQRSEVITPQRQLLTFRCRRDQPEPIRLFWPIDKLSAGVGEADESLAITLPEVISAGSATTPPAWIATRAAEGFRWLPVGAPESASDAADVIDSFVTAWKGHRGTAQQVIRSSGPLSRLLLLAQPRPDWRCEELHHLHVRQGEMLLRYEGWISRGDRSLGPLRLLLPARYEIRQLTINGVDVPTATRSAGGVAEVLLPDVAGGERLRVELHARQSLLLTEPFELPRVRIEPILRVTGTYSLTRDQALRIEQIRESDFPETDQTHLEIGDQLLNGWIPCWTWQFDEAPTATSPIGPVSDRPVLLGGTFRVEPLATRVEVLQRAGVLWTPSRWLADTRMSVRTVGPTGESQPLLDDINVQWPSAWADKLVVEPAEAWSIQPALDPAMRIIRIRPMSTDRERGSTSIRIRGYRSGDADSLPEIPRPQLLGADAVETYLVVPTTAGSRPLIWTTLSAVVDQLPQELDEETLDSGANETALASAANDRLVFRALGPGANVRLQPSRSEITTARASLADIQWFPQRSDRGLAMIRWDVEPGDTSEVSLRIPAGIRPQAVWAGGQSVPLRPPGEGEPHVGEYESNDNESGLRGVASEPVTDDDGSMILPIPFTFTGLAQPVVLLCELTEVPAGRPWELPRLLEVEVGETWLTIHPRADRDVRLRLRSDESSSGWSNSEESVRLAALAESILTITQASIDGATDRTGEELIAWLKPWNRRMLDLQRQASRWASGLEEGGPEDGSSRVAELAETGESPDPPSAGATSESAPAPGSFAAWDEISDRWQQYLTRVAGVETIGRGASTVQAREPSPPGTQWPVEIARHPGAAPYLPAVVPDHPDSIGSLPPKQWGLLGGVVLAGGLLWGFRHHWVTPLSRPAFWLFALGLASLAFAPIPVAIAICFVAISGPLLAGRPASPRDPKARFGL